jgi:hypothetical protein
MARNIERRYIPIKDRQNFGQLRFPKLKDAVVKIPTLSDMREEDVSIPKKRREVRERKLSKANKRLNAVLGATSEFRQVRFNNTYKGIVDTLGEGFPLHPEYLYVIDTIVNYYGVSITDVLEFANIKEQLKYEKAEHVSYSLRLFNVPTSACLTMLAYFLYVQYECNPVVLLEMFNISIEQLRSLIESFSRQYDNSLALRDDYAIIHGRLLKLQGIAE